MCQVRLFVLSRLLSSLWVCRTGSASDWCALQEALYKFIDTIQYNTIGSDELPTARTLGIFALFLGEKRSWIRVSIEVSAGKEFFRGTVFHDQQILIEWVVG